MVVKGLVIGRERERERDRERERETWCFTPSQPLQLYEGERERSAHYSLTSLASISGGRGRKLIYKLQVEWSQIRTYRVTLVFVRVLALLSFWPKRRLCGCSEVYPGLSCVAVG